MEKVAAHLSLKQRRVIYSMVKSGFSIREISKEIGKHRSTVWRELNLRSKPERKVWREMSALERAAFMEEQAERMRTDWRKGPRTNLDRVPVQKRVVEMIVDGKRSAEQAAMILAVSDEAEKMCGRTIRRWVDKSHPQLKKSFPQKGKKRRKRESASTSNGMLSIHSRPYACSTRSRVGDYEIDLIVCSQNTHCILSIRERFTRKIWLRKLSNRKAETVRQELYRVFREIPPPLRITATYDRDKSFSDLDSFSKAFNIDNYVCDPYSSWQKGAVENGNAQVRRFFPSGSDLSLVTQLDLDKAANWINITPMLCLGKRSPEDVWLLESINCREMLH